MKIASVKIQNWLNQTKWKKKIENFIIRKTFNHWQLWSSKFSFLGNAVSVSSHLIHLFTNWLKKLENMISIQIPINCFLLLLNATSTKTNAAKVRIDERNMKERIELTIPFDLLLYLSLVHTKCYLFARNLHS